jgi:hypothetical protein
MTSGLVVANGNSTVTVENPNSTGTYVLRLPEVPQLQPGESMIMQLRAVGTPTGAILTFEVPGTTEALTRQPSNLVQQPVSVDAQQLAVDGVNGRVAKVVHAFAELDLPLIPSGDGVVVRVNMPNIRAGAAITVSPAGEMAGGLHPAYGWAPIDCVVLIKFLNSGSTPADLEPMQFGIGAINPD